MCISKNICGNNDAPWSMYVCFISRRYKIFICMGHANNLKLVSCFFFFGIILT